RRGGRAHGRAPRGHAPRTRECHGRPGRRALGRSLRGRSAAAVPDRREPAVPDHDAAARAFPRGRAASAARRSARPARGRAPDVRDAAGPARARLPVRLHAVVRRAADRPPGSRAGVPSAAARGVRRRGAPHAPPPRVRPSGPGAVPSSGERRVPASTEAASLGPRPRGRHRSRPRDRAARIGRHRARASARGALARRVDRARARRGRSERVSRAVVLAAPAKVNLTLEVLARRPDGYRELASVFATVDMRDRVRVAPSRVLDVRVAPAVGAAPGDDLASRAVRALAEASGRPALAYVRVRKRIPVASGLGGGSSDAGAVLRGLARAWRLDGVDLTPVAAQIGSDVPFFVSGAAYAFVRGRGELVEPLPMAEPFWIALVHLPRGLPTAEVFAAHRATPSKGERSTSLAKALRDRKVTISLVRECLQNDLLAAA